jgi:hypothetical protein
VRRTLRPRRPSQLLPVTKVFSGSGLAGNSPGGGGIDQQFSRLLTNLLETSNVIETADMTRLTESPEAICERILGGVSVLDEISQDDPRAALPRGHLTALRRNGHPGASWRNDRVCSRCGIWGGDHREGSTTRIEAFWAFAM